MEESHFVSHWYTEAIPSSHLRHGQPGLELADVAHTGFAICVEWSLKAPVLPLSTSGLASLLTGVAISSSLCSNVYPKFAIPHPKLLECC